MPRTNHATAPTLFSHFLLVIPVVLFLSLGDHNTSMCTLFKPHSKPKPSYSALGSHKTFSQNWHENDNEIKHLTISHKKLTTENSNYVFQVHYGHIEIAKFINKNGDHYQGIASSISPNDTQTRRKSHRRMDVEIKPRSSSALNSEKENEAIITTRPPGPIPFRSIMTNIETKPGLLYRALLLALPAPAPAPAPAPIPKPILTIPIKLPHASTTNNIAQNPKKQYEYEYDHSHPHHHHYLQKSLHSGETNYGLDYDKNDGQLVIITKKEGENVLGLIKQSKQVDHFHHVHVDYRYYEEIGKEIISVQRERQRQRRRRHGDPSEADRVRPRRHVINTDIPETINTTTATAAIITETESSTTPSPFFNNNNNRHHHPENETTMMLKDAISDGSYEVRKIIAPPPGAGPRPGEMMDKRSPLRQKSTQKSHRRLKDADKGKSLPMPGGASDSDRLVKQIQDIGIGLGRVSTLTYLNKRKGRFSLSPSHDHPEFIPSVAVSLPLMPIIRKENEEAQSSISILHGSRSRSPAGPGPGPGPGPGGRGPEVQMSMSRERVLINCACDTLDCISNGQQTCKTFEVCYTQHLPMRDGTSTVTRGCISGPTPLLCENRPPKIVTLWPVLNCCKVDMCNGKSDEKNADSSRASPGSGTDNREEKLRITSSPTTATTYPLPVTYISAITLVWNKTEYESEGPLRSLQQQPIDLYETNFHSNNASSPVSVNIGENNEQGNVTGGRGRDLDLESIHVFLNAGGNSSPGTSPMYPELSLIRSTSSPATTMVTPPSVVTINPKHKSGNSRLSPGPGPSPGSEPGHGHGHKGKDSFNSNSNVNSLGMNGNGMLSKSSSVSHADTTSSRKKSVFRHSKNAKANMNPNKTRNHSFEKRVTDPAKIKGSEEGVRTNRELKEKFLATLLENNRDKSLQKVSPLAIGFLIGGAIIILLISTVGFWILKREQEQQHSRSFMPSSSGCSYSMALPNPDPDRFVSMSSDTNLRCDEEPEPEPPEPEGCPPDQEHDHLNQIHAQNPCLRTTGCDWSETNTFLPQRPRQSHENNMLVRKYSSSKMISGDSVSTTVSDGVTPTSVLSTEAFIIHECRS